MRWFRSYWSEEDTWFYFEADAEGWVTRQIELEGPHEKPVAAASLAESEAAERAGSLADYESLFGSTAGLPVHQWEGYEPEDLTVEAFENVWLTARAACQTRDRARSSDEA